MAQNPHYASNWYWIVGGSTTQVYSSAAAAYVTLPDATYSAWVTGPPPSTATSIATEAELWDVLAQAYPAGIALGNVPGQEAIAKQRTYSDAYFTLSDNLDPTKKLRWQLSGIATGTLRTWIVPDADMEVVGKDTNQTLTNKSMSTGSLFITNLAVSKANPAMYIAGQKVGGNQWGFVSGDGAGEVSFYNYITSGGYAVWQVNLAAIGAATFSLLLTTPSTSFSNGALVLAGGLGVAGNINAGGQVRSFGAIGYAAGGSAGSVTQITSKATSVTLNTICGTISTHNASLAANTTVSFGLSNSALKSGDMLILTAGNTSAGNYAYWGNVWGDGNASIWIRNLTAGALAESVVIDFAVFKKGN